VEKKKESVSFETPSNKVGDDISAECGEVQGRRPQQIACTKGSRLVCKTSRDSPLKDKKNPVKTPGLIKLATTYPLSAAMCKAAGCSRSPA